MTHESTLSEESSQLAGRLAPALAVLRAVAAEGHLTRAGERLGMPQPTVSRTLARLAEHVGHPLLVHRGRGVELTRAGEQLAASAEEALRTLENGCRRVVEDLDPERGRVALGFQHTMGSSLVPPLLRDFRDRHPQVRFDLSQGPRDELVERTATGDLDLCLVAPLPDSDHWNTAPLRTEPLVLVLHAEHRLHRRKRLRLADAAEEEFIMIRHGYGMRRIITTLAERAGVAPRIAFEVDDVDTVRGLVAAGLGIALLPEAETAPLPGTVEVPLHPPAHRTIGLAWPRGTSLPPAGARFRDFAAEQARTPGG
ncbi:LysR family transcriptional regulator [Salinifilum aidingensis]